MENVKFPSIMLGFISPTSPPLLPHWQREFEMNEPETQLVATSDPEFYILRV